jgi:hypothetical protein
MKKFSYIPIFGCLLLTVAFGCSANVENDATPPATAVEIQQPLQASFQTPTHNLKTSRHPTNVLEHGWVLPNAKESALVIATASGQLDLLRMETQKVEHFPQLVVQDVASTIPPSTHIRIVSADDEQGSWLGTWSPGESEVVVPNEFQLPEGTSSIVHGSSPTITLSYQQGTQWVVHSKYGQWGKSLPVVSAVAHLSPSVISQNHTWLSMLVAVDASPKIITIQVDSQQWHTVDERAVVVPKHTCEPKIHWRKGKLLLITQNKQLLTMQDLDGTIFFENQLSIDGCVESVIQDNQDNLLFLFGSQPILLTLWEGENGWKRKHWSLDGWVPMTVGESHAMLFDESQHSLWLALGTHLQRVQWSNHLEQISLAESYKSQAIALANLRLPYQP